MRTFASIPLAALAGVLIAGVASATVGPEVELRLVGPPRPVEPGKPFAGQIEITVGTDSLVSGMRFERPRLADGSRGAGPQILSLDAPLTKWLASNESLVVKFEILHEPAESLVFAVELDGRPVVKSFDLSPEHFELMTEGVQLIELEDPAFSEGQARAAESSPRSSVRTVNSTTRTVSVHGQFVYRGQGACVDSDFDNRPDSCSNNGQPCGSCSITTERPCGSHFECPAGETCDRVPCGYGYHGADTVKVRVKDDALGPDPVLGEGWTDANGHFDVSFTTDGTPDVYVEFETKNGVVAVEDATWERNYKFKTATFEDYGGTSLGLSTLVPTAKHPAIAIHNSITRLARWYYEEDGDWTPSVDVQWPDGGVSRYKPFWQEIHINPEHEWNTWVHAHEWGHHWSKVFGAYPDVDYCNQVCDGAGCAAEGHCPWCSESEQIAWIEGWADWIADAFIRSYRDRYLTSPNTWLLNVEDLPYNSGDLDCRTTEDVPCQCNPYDTELFLAALLRDIEDSPRTLFFPQAIDPAGEVEQHDFRLLQGDTVAIRASRQVNLGAQGTLDPLVRLWLCDDAWSCSTFLAEDNDSGSKVPPGPGRNALIPLYRYGSNGPGNHRIEVEGVDSTIGPYLAEVEFWDDADRDEVGDELALGTDEIFFIARTDKPTTPQEFLDAFLWRYPGYLKPLWATATNNLFYIPDNLAPGVPVDLTSTTHTLGDPSSRPIITYTWTPPTDDVSGIGGYCVTWSNSPVPPPNCEENDAGMQRIGNVSTFTTTNLFDGDWYFSIRAVDRSGKWSPDYATFGPITIIPQCAIFVEVPNGGQSWRMGASHQIHWRCNSGRDVSYGHEPVTLELWKAGELYRTIGTSQSDSKNWEIPIDVVPGSDYRIVITSQDWPDDTDASDANFTIEGDLIDNGDGTVSHRNSCLMWLKDAGSAGRTMTWEDANAWAQRTVAAGYWDWRLPSGSNPDGTVCNTRLGAGICPETELGTLYYRRMIRTGNSDPFINVGWDYWTSTQDPNDPTRGMLQDMLDGGQFDDPKTEFAGVWAVRTIGGCDPAPGFPPLQVDGDNDDFFTADDCDDTNRDVNPLEDELCGDAIDNDCDGVINEFCGCGERLVDNGDGTVTEADTCLMWVKNFDDPALGGGKAVFWQDAVDFASNLTFAGYDDWRLAETLVPDPTCDSEANARGLNCRGSEMGRLHYVSLANQPGQPPGCTGPFLNYGHGFTFQRFWSATEDPTDSSKVYYFIFNDGISSGAQETYRKFTPQDDFYIHRGNVLPVRLDHNCLLDADADGYHDGLDCDNADAMVYPGAWELCDGKDNDCDGMTDEDSALAQFCSTGLGACEVSGTRLCSAQDLGTRLLGDRRPGVDGSYPDILGEAGGVLLFEANDGSVGSELWMTDGTQVGTMMLQDINPGPSGSAILSIASATVGGWVLFGADNGNDGRELWKSDGTTAGTTLVQDIFPGPTGSSPTGFTAVGGSLFFEATGSTTTGQELWISDGTAAGTVMVKDIRPGGTSSSIEYLTDVAGTAFFVADDGSRGRELWKSDGTAAGTTLVKDIATDIGSSFPQNLEVLSGTLFFRATDGTNGAELWKSDGTAAGTVMVKDINPSPPGSRPAYLTAVNGVLFFGADDGVHGSELWRSDGTAAGTTMVKDIRPGPNSSLPYQLRQVGNTLFFWADDGIHGMELWKSDGTAAGTVLVAEVAPGPASSDPTEATEFDGLLLFSAYNVSVGSELWKSDGTATGTTLVKDIAPDDWGSYPNQFRSYGGRLFFVAEDDANGVELWLTDGTEDGTTCDAVPGTPSGEFCDGLDNDCDGQVDDDATDATTWYEDLDGDGYGRWTGPWIMACDPPAGFVANADDCNDFNANENPSLPEIGCDGQDNDCNLATPDLSDADGDGLACDVDCDDLAASCTTDCSDGDGDGLPDCAALLADGDGDGVFESDDCDDADPNNWTSCTSCVDVDGDGHYAGCDAYATIAGPDCDDTLSTIHPGAWEVNDGIDNQCEGDEGYGLVDEISGETGFLDPGDKRSLSWTPQQGATRYEVVRSGQPYFETCTVFAIPDSSWIDPEIPTPGAVFHYLIRAAGPNVGSWGVRSSGLEQTPSCAN